MTHPKPVAIVRSEGDLWLPFPENRGGEVHAIKFADGSILDTHNGWREAGDIKPHVNIPLRNEGLPS